MPVPHFGQLGTFAAGVGNGDGSQFAVFAGPRTVRIIASKAAPSISSIGLPLAKRAASGVKPLHAAMIA